MNDETRDLISAWALDAVEPEERAEIEALVDRDPEARAEADAMREAAAYLALADDRVSEPVDGDVWDRIVEATGGTAGTSADEMAASVTIGAAPIALDSRRTARRRPNRVLLVAGVAAAAALMFVVGVSIGRSQSAPVSTEAAMWAQAQRTGKTVVLTKNNKDLARVGVLADGTAVVHNDALPALPEGKTYQLWAVLGDPNNPTVISAGVLGSRITDAPVTFAGTPSAYVLTIEDAPGVAVSSQVATASGTVA